MDASDWDSKMHELRDQYPEIKGIDWGGVFIDHPNIFSNISTGIAKVAIADQKKSGVEGERDLEFIYGIPMSEEPFSKALDRLWKGRTVGEMSKITGVSSAVIRKLHLGERVPLFEEMEMIAAAFNLDPGYFLEYRIGKVLSAIDGYMLSSPEVSMAWYKKVKDRKGLSI